MTDKNKQNIRFAQTSQRLNKHIRYDGLTPEQVKYIKTQKEFEQVDKDLNSFWKLAPRQSDGAVNWSIINDEQLDYFEAITKKKDKLMNKVDKLIENGVNPAQTSNLFIMLNCQSASF